jgi:hypothetical protein
MWVLTTKTFSDKLNINVFRDSSLTNKACFIIFTVRNISKKKILTLRGDRNADSSNEHDLYPSAEVGPGILQNKSYSLHVCKRSDECIGQIFFFR